MRRGFGTKHHLWGRAPYRPIYSAIVRRGSIMRRLCSRVTLLTLWALALNGLTPVWCLAAAAHEPVEQISETLETVAHRQLAGLYVTALEANDFELSWVVAMLPCPTQHFRLQTTTAQIASTLASTKEVEIAIVAARMPRGIHCGAVLPAAADEGSAIVTVSPAIAGKAIAAPMISYADAETKIESFSGCMTLAEICPGRYVLRAYLNAPRRRVSLEYVFTVAAVSGEPEGESYDPLGALLRASNGGESQCPVP